MRTHLHLDDDDLAFIKRYGKHRTTTDAVRAAIRSYAHRLSAQALLDLGGKVDWRGNLNDMRKLREPQASAADARRRRK